MLWIKKNRIAVYTAIFGDYDKLNIPDKKIEGCDFYCFTDNKNLKSDLYKIINIEREFSDPTRDARKIKILSHKYLPEYEYTLWMDANVLFRNFDVKKMFKEFLADYDVAMHKHSARNCTYDEAVACVNREVDDPLMIISQMVRYLNEGYPAKRGLVETGIIFRRNTNLTRKINEDWWNEIKNGSRRDQLSVDYAIWKNNANYFKINGKIKDNRFFYAEKHKSNSYSKREKNLELNELKKRIIEIESKNCKECYLDNKKMEEIKMLEERIENKEKLIKIMENSVFWKLRNLYIKYKNKLFFLIFHPISFAKKYLKKI